MSNIGRELLYAFRGIPTKCDFCDTPHEAHELEPEEAGMWVCRTCLNRWDEAERINEQKREAP